MTHATKTSPAKTSKKVAGAQLVELRIDTIRVDQDTYQRPQIDAHVRRIAATFDPDLFTAPTVIHRMDGTYWVVDGQQRLAAVRTLGFTHVWAKVIHARNIRHEAELFVKHNSNAKRLGTQDMYKAALASEEQVSMAIESVLNEFDLTAIHTSSAREVRAIAKLREAFGPAAAEINVQLDDATLENGKKVLRWALAAGKGQIDKGHRAGDVFRGANLGALIWIRREAKTVPNLLRVQKLLAKTTPTYLKEEITGITGSAGGSKRALWGTRLAHWINTQSGKTIVDLPADAWMILFGDETTDDGPSPIAA